MKKNEIALLLIVVGFVILGTYALLNSVLGTALLKPVEVETAEKMESVIVEPDATVFNKDALNPSLSVSIGDQSNQQPFSAQR